MLGIFFSDDLVLEACDGEVAMEIIEKIQPDIVISDIDMPKKDGIFLLTETQKKFPQIPFIMMSGRPDYKRRVEELGAVFMEKPFSLIIMAKEMEKAIKGAKK